MVFIPPQPVCAPKINVAERKLGKFAVRTLQLTSSDVPASLSGMQIVQLSDLHLGPSTSLVHLARAIDIVKDINPSLVVLTGDLVQSERVGLRRHLAQRHSPRLLGLARLEAASRRNYAAISKLLGNLQLKFGICGIFGNHDYYEGIAIARMELSNDLLWLVNERAAIKTAGGSLEIIGVDDYRRGEPCLKTALTSNPVPLYAEDSKSTDESIEEKTLRLLLCHNPDFLLSSQVDYLKGIHLMLAGHTHGGQLCLPYVPPLVTRTKQKEHVRGLGYFRNTAIYVSSGTGYGNIGLRIYCPPEITIIELCSA